MINFNDIQTAQARYQEMVPQLDYSYTNETETAVSSFSYFLTKLGQQLQGVRITRTPKQWGYS